MLHLLKNMPSECESVHVCILLGQSSYVCAHFNGWTSFEFDPQTSTLKPRSNATASREEVPQREAYPCVPQPPPKRASRHLYGRGQIPYSRRPQIQLG